MIFLGVTGFITRFVVKGKFDFGFVLMCLCTVSGCFNGFDNSKSILQGNQMSEDKTSWLDHVAKITEKQNSGKFIGVDKNGVQLVLEWEKIEASKVVLDEKMEKLADIVAKAHAPVNVKFLQECPEAVSTVKDFKPFGPLFKNGVDSVDWKFVEKMFEIGSRSYFVESVTKRQGKKDVFCFVTVKEKDGNTPIGFIQFLITQKYDYGTIKVGNLMFLPIAQHRGLGKLLISSIFKILPYVGINHIILRTLQTNEQAISAYESYGFKKYEDKGEKVEADSLDRYKVCLEYKTEQSEKLQKESQKLE